MGSTDIFANAAQWILHQAGWVILAIIAVAGLMALIQRRIMALVGTIIAGGFLAMFVFGGQGMMQSIAALFQHILGL